MIDVSLDQFPHGKDIIRASQGKVREVNAPARRAVSSIQRQSSFRRAAAKWAELSLIRKSDSMIRSATSNRSIGLCVMVLLVIAARGLAEDKPADASQPAAVLNTLTDAEKAAGWKLLFDGKTGK